MNIEKNSKVKHFITQQHGKVIHIDRSQKLTIKWDNEPFVSESFLDEVELINESETSSIPVIKQTFKAAEKSTQEIWEEEITRPY